MHPFIIENVADTSLTVTNPGWIVNSLHWSRNVAIKTALALMARFPGGKYRIRQRDANKSEIVVTHDDLVKLALKSA